MYKVNRRGQTAVKNRQWQFNTCDKCKTSHFSERISGRTVFKHSEEPILMGACEQRKTVSIRLLIQLVFIITFTLYYTEVHISIKQKPMNDGPLNWFWVLNTLPATNPRLVNVLRVNEMNWAVQSVLTSTGVNLTDTSVQSWRTEPEERPKWRLGSLCLAVYLADTASPWLQSIKLTS